VSADRNREAIIRGFRGRLILTIDQSDGDRFVSALARLSSLAVTYSVRRSPTSPEVAIRIDLEGASSEELSTTFVDVMKAVEGTDNVSRRCRRDHDSAGRAPHDADGWEDMRGWTDIPEGWRPDRWFRCF
jgi:hypothetical protein